MKTNLLSNKAAKKPEARKTASRIVSQPASFNDLLRQPKQVCARQRQARRPAGTMRELTESEPYPDKKLTNV